MSVRTLVSGETTLFCQSGRRDVADGLDAEMTKNESLVGLGA